MFGRHPIGSASFGGLRASTAMQPQPGEVVPRTDRTTLRLLGHYLTFYKLTSSSGNVLRVVDKYDPEHVNTDGQTEFDSQQWDYWPVERDAIEHRNDSFSPAFQLTTLDPARVLLSFAEDNNRLSGANLEIYIVRYDQLGVAVSSPTYRGQVKSISVTEQPTTTVSLQISGPQLRNKQYPGRRTNRWRCFNAFGARHLHYREQNFCNWPSDEFGAQTQQWLQTQTKAAVERSHGWWVQNGNGVDSLDGVQALYVNGEDLLQGGFKGLYVNVRAGSTDDLLWFDADRDAPYVFRRFEVANGLDFDVAFKVENVNHNSSNPVIAGLLVTGDAPDELRDSVIWGHQAFEDVSVLDTVFRLYYQETFGDVSAIETFNPTDLVYPTSTTHGTPNVFRVKRSGSTWTFYTRDEQIDDDTEPESPSWDLHKSMTWDWQPTGHFRIGLVVQCDQGANPAVRFPWIRYYGLGDSWDCDRSFRRCAQLQNTIQFNGMLGLPDSSPISRY